jgi:paired amphipathic helix protein Sin3a
LTIQLLSKEDQITDDTITSEEKWSLYVDQFVQLNASENVNMKRREPFLKRSLPAHIDEDPPLNVETKSGLELKICVNTYKIFFVDNTEDYFKRKVTTNGSLLGLTFTESSKGRTNRSDKFHTWLNSKKGWKNMLEDAESVALEKSFKAWRT